MEPLEISFRGGIRWGNFNATWPLALLRIRGNRLTISSFGVHRRFCPGQIVSVKIRQGFSPGVRIIHRKAIYPEYVIFWTWAPELVQEALQRFAAQ